MPKYRYHIFTCLHERPADDPKGSCMAGGAQAILKTFKSELKKKGLKKEVRANKSGCLDQCAKGPVVVIYPEGVWYTLRTVEDVLEVVDRHIENGQVVTRLLLKD